VSRALLALLAALALLAGCGSGERRAAPAAPASPPATPAADAAPALPDPDAPLPRDAAGLANRLAETTLGLRAAVERWRDAGDPARGDAPRDVRAFAAEHRRLHRELARHPRLAARVLARLPRRVRGEARDTHAAQRALAAIPVDPDAPKPKIRIGPAQPAGRLLRHYAAAEDRFGVDWHVLAAVNFVESRFGRLRNRSYAGARGPMQFMPATWAQYGLGGDIEDPRDAILAAANYLRASGAPGDYRSALYAYNRSTAYVRAILRYARRIDRDPRMFYAYYAWPL